MQATAIVNYHLTSADAQAYHIDADGEPGKIISPELVPTEVDVHDLRNPDVSASFLEDSVSIVHSPSKIHEFDGAESWKTTYDQELEDLLAREIGAKEVVVFDHTVRLDDPGSGRRPARNVHCDYSPAGARQRLRDLVGEEVAAEWETGHFGFVNVWRPVKNVINSAPLGFVRPISVSPEDWLEIRLIYPDRIGQIMGLVANETHEWMYRSKMTPDEVAYFNIYDNRGLASIAHSALDRVEDSSIQVPRMSIESRTLIRY